MFKKILCFLFGHKSVDPPVYDLISQPINKKRHRLRITACKRCIMFESKEIISEEDYMQILNTEIQSMHNLVKQFINEDDLEALEGVIDEDPGSTMLH